MTLTSTSLQRLVKQVFSSPNYVMLEARLYRTVLAHDAWNSIIPVFCLLAVSMSSALTNYLKTSVDDKAAGRVE
jgi:hypothetical protein